MIEIVKPKRVYKRKVVEKEQPPVKDIPNNQDCYNEFGSGSQKFSVPIKNTNHPIIISVFAAPSGCGFKILRGNTCLIQATDQGMLDLKTSLERTYENDVVAATLGDDHFSPAYTSGGRNYEEPLLKLGFVKAMSYPNLNHGAKYKQHMYLKYPKSYKPDAK